MPQPHSKPHPSNVEGLLKAEIGDRLAPGIARPGAADVPMVILLHGFKDFLWGWRRQVGPLKIAGFRVIAPDRKNYDLTTKPIGLRAYDLDGLAADLIGLADAYERQKFILIGHGLGGSIGWWIASRYPNRVERLIAINSVHPQVLMPCGRGGLTRRPRSGRVDHDRVSWLRESLSHIGEFAVARRLFIRHPEPGALTGLINWCRALRRKRDVESWRVKAPTLMLWGGKNGYLDKGAAEASLALCDNAKAVWIESGTHLVHLEEPEIVNKALLDFLKT